MSLVRLRPEAPYAGVAHPVERHLAKVEVASSSLVTRSKMAFGSFGSYNFIKLVTWPSGKAKVCKTFTPRFKSGWRLQRLSENSVRAFAARTELLLFGAFSPVQVFDDRIFPLSFSPFISRKNRQNREAKARTNDVPPYYIYAQKPKSAKTTSRCGGIGRRKGLKIPR